MPRMGDAQAAASVELAYEHFTVMLDTAGGSPGSRP